MSSNVDPTALLSLNLYSSLRRYVSEPVDVIEAPADSAELKQLLDLAEPAKTVEEVAQLLLAMLPKPNESGSPRAWEIIEVEVKALRHVLEADFKEERKEGRKRSGSGKLVRVFDQTFGKSKHEKQAFQTRHADSYELLALAEIALPVLKELSSK